MIFMILFSILFTLWQKSTVIIPSKRVPKPSSSFFSNEPDPRNPLAHMAGKIQQKFPFFFCIFVPYLCTIGHSTRC